MSATTVKTIAGTGVAGRSADGVPAVSAQIAEPFGVVVGPDDAVYFCDLGNHRIRRIKADGSIETVVGSGRTGYAGDGGPALAADLIEPYEIRFDADRNLYFVDMQAHVVRRVEARSQVISTIAGTGQAGFSGDGGAAVEAMLSQPHSIELDGRGALYVADIRNHRIRRVDLGRGTIDTFAGTGEQAPTPDGAALAGSPLNGPRAMAFDAHGDMFLALREGNAVLRLDMVDRSIHHVAGNGEFGYRDGPDAREAPLSGPKGIALDRRGGVVIADTESHTVRRIDLASGGIETVLGTGRQHDGPDGDPLACGLARPHGVFVDPGDRLLVGDSDNHRVRVVE